MKGVLVFNGPVGVGKSIIGRAVAIKLRCPFIDADDLRNHEISWVTDNRKTLLRLADLVLKHIPHTDRVVGARPLRKRDLLFLQARLESHEVSVNVVTLSAGLDDILSSRRQRRLSPAEAARAKKMIEEGYASRDFSATILRADGLPVEETISLALQAIRETPNAEAGRVERS